MSASQTMFEVSHQHEPAQIEPIHASVSQSDMFTLSQIKPLLDLLPSRSKIGRASVDMYWLTVSDTSL